MPPKKIRRSEKRRSWVIALLALSDIKIYTIFRERELCQGVVGECKQ